MPLAPSLAYADKPDVDHPVVVEMFLSQACKASPAGAEVLVELGDRPDLVVLSWHVDYWNLLSHRKYGRWKDPFSKAAFSQRQRIYNRQIRNRHTVFTPQAIIGGAASVVGSKRDALETQINRGRALLKSTDINIARDNETLSVTIDKSADAAADVYLISFHAWAETNVTAGDNAGVVFREPNVVADMTRLGESAYGEQTFAAPAPQDGMGCAIIVQTRGQGAILGARYCP